MHQFVSLCGVRFVSQIERNTVMVTLHAWDTDDHHMQINENVRYELF